MNLRHLLLALLLILLTCTRGTAQTCQSETEVPSTTPASRFLKHGNGTVTDTVSGLMWAQCAEGLSGSACTVGEAANFTWEEALIRARDSVLAGYTDWRLPNLKELFSMVEERCVDPAINLAVFPNTPASYFWSASPSADSSHFAWIVGFMNGGADYGSRYSYSQVRLVRSGQ